MFDGDIFRYILILQVLNFVLWSVVKQMMRSRDTYIVMSRDTCDIDYAHHQPAV